MSLNVKFAEPGSRIAADGNKVLTILPYEVLINLQGRRVTVLLSVKSEELEGTLVTVDSDRGDLFLEDVVHYRWDSQTAKDAGSSRREGGAANGNIEVEEGFPCVGGGSRCELHRYQRAMVNSRYIDIITPTVFELAERG